MRTVIFKVNYEDTTVTKIADAIMSLPGTEHVRQILPLEGKQLNEKAQVEAFEQSVDNGGAFYNYLSGYENGYKYALNT